MQRRRLLGLTLWLPTWVAAQPRAAGLPLRNLLVELRQGEATRFEADEAGVGSGSFVVGADGRASARVGVTLEARGRDATADAVLRVQVINGGRAALRVGASVPLQWLEWVATPAGPIAIVGSQRVETGRGFVVRPRWPGGDAPVTVELHSESATLATGGLPSRHAPDGQPLPDGAVDRSGLLTTLQLPLGQWVTVASSGSDERRPPQRDALSVRSLAREQREIVQLRITLP